MNPLRILMASIMGLFGISSSADDVRSVDPKSVLFSICTLNDSLPAEDPSTRVDAETYIINEDDWRQFEFVSGSLGPTIDVELAAISELKRTESVPVGEYSAFKRVYVRSKVGIPVEPRLSYRTLVDAIGSEGSAGSAVAIGGSSHAIRGGFVLTVDDLVLYGLRQEDDIAVLGLDINKRPHLSHIRAAVIAKVLSDAGLVLVHWPGVTRFADENSLASFLDASWKPHSN